ncbi:hypothetical protein FRC05_009334 [Tulasnella sp. 425]|nr:hypothetical protein FRC05_009334 [Tulasnella sp. 425]
MCVIKPEPIDEGRVLQERNVFQPMGTSSSKVKPEPDAAEAMLGETMNLVDEKPIVSRSATNTPSVGSKENKDQVPVAPSAPQYDKYTSPEEITYNPEAALKTGLGIVGVIKEKIRLLDIGNQMRKDVWKKELDELSAHSTPTTLIAICGATGAGKSSVINAVLDDTIVPTSGMRACTAVVTEIAYKPGRSIEGDVSFLSREEWKAELQILLEDLHDENGKVKAPTDMKSEAGVAWSKVHAVYPQIPLDFLVTLTADQIIARDPGIERTLGTTRKISAANSKEFGKAIAPFIDSKEKKRGKAHDEKTSKKNDKAEGPALWPLIRIVKVRCPAKALESGAVLVDLPGTADANAARSSIAQGYMQRCQCVWILAPVTRAVDDKTAKDLLGKAFKTQLMMDGNYDTSTVTFVATKTDDISCNEIITALRLEDDPELLEIEDKIRQYRRDENEKRKAKEQADAEGKKLGQAFREKRAIVLEYKEWIRALKDDKDFEPTLTATKKAKGSQPQKTESGKKRKSSGESPKAKRRKSNRDADDEDDPDLDGFVVDDHDSDSDSDIMSDVESVVSKVTASDKDSDDERSENGDDDVVEDMVEEDEESEEEVTVESLKAKQTIAEDEAREIKEKLEATKNTARDALKQLDKLETRLAKAQRQKNGFCAKARNEYSRDSLKEDWRAGVREMDQEAAMQKDPDNFDPSFEARDYAAINLPTFTVSSRDYIRLTKQVEGDGKPTCFSDTKDTQIPDLQAWCHSLTISSRERTARSFLQKLKTFAAAVESYLDDMNNVSEVDRAQLRKRWASDYEDPSKHSRGEQNAQTYDPYDFGFNLDRYLAEYGEGFEPQAQTPQEPAPANPGGVAPVLKRKFTELVDEAVYNLHDIFKAGLEEKLKIGSATAYAMAYETSMNFGNSMHWSTFRAHLRRDGVFRRDLNAELCLPLTSSIAKSWGEVFEQDLFAEFGRQTTLAIEKVIEEIKDSAAPGLAERCNVQGNLATEDAETALKAMIQVVHEALQKEQKEISRSLSPHVQEQLRDVYIRAMEERGRGSVARQKDVVNRGVQDSRGDMFAGGSNILMSKLTLAAETVGKALDASLSELARKVEVLMSVLWEDINTTTEQMVIRSAAVEVMAEISQQIQFWIRAEESRRKQGTLV